MIKFMAVDLRQQILRQQMLSGLCCLRVHVMQRSSPVVDDTEDRFPADVLRSACVRVDTLPLVARRHVLQRPQLADGERPTTSCHIEATGTIAVTRALTKMGFDMLPALPPMSTGQVAPQSREYG